MGPKCKTSRAFIAITKKSMVKNHNQNTLKLWSKKKLGEKDRRADFLLTFALNSGIS